MLVHQHARKVSKSIIKITYRSRSRRLVGITYNTWITPVKKAPGKFNTRTGLGGFSDRVGALAYALTPLSILLSSRDSALSLLTGIPYTSFLFLHVWTGRVIFIQSFLHTLGWTIIEARLYQPQPSVYREFMAEMYIIFGVVAMFLVTVLYLGSLKIVVRRTGYQFFKLTHYITAALYLGACWGHWADLACWMIAAIILLALDRGVRLIRLLLIHTGHVDASNPIGFKSAKASIKVFADGDVGQIVRMEFEHNHGPWCAGQHFFLTFPALGWWQAHPFTPAALSSEHPRWQRHVYVLRVKKGITRRLADLALGGGGESSLDVLLTGPYGAGNELADSGTPRNTFAIAGGTGISFVLPAVLHRLSAKTETSSTSTTQLVWIIRISADIRWFLPELEGLKKTIEARTEYKEDKLGQSAADKVQIQILVTRESEDSTEAKAADPLPRNPTASDNSEVNRKETGLFQTATGSSSLAELLDAHCANGRFIRIQRLHNHHPDIGQLLDVFAASCSSGPIEVIGSGPPGMGSDLRSAVARLNQGGRVWRGEESGYVRLVCDAREL